MMQPWEILLRRLQAARRWPLGPEANIHKMLRVWAALRESDEILIRQLMQWPADRALLIDNLPEKIPAAFGDLLFGRDPRVTPASPADAARAKALTAAYAAELPAAEETCMSEGEVWWRLTTDPALEHPVLTWHSRRDVVPLLRGRQAVAVAFIDRLENISSDRGIVYRHVEIHGEGIVLNLLFRGRDHALGQEVDLTRHYETDQLRPVWNTEISGILAGRVVNRWGRRPHVGVSVYQGSWNRMLALNESTTIGHENVRLTAKKRLTGPSSALRRSMAQPTDPLRGERPVSVDRGDGSRTIQNPLPQFTMDAGEDFIVNDPLDIDEGTPGANAISVLEYGFDAAALIAWLKFETETICQRCDVVPQFIGNGDFGNAPSGTALRVRLIPTVNAAESRGRAWDCELPIIVQRAQMLEASPQLNGGLGNTSWTNAGGVPAIERSDALPEDLNEEATRHATLKTAGLISVEESLRERHEDWDQARIDAEVEAIRADESASMPPATPFGPPPPAPPAPEPAPPPGG